MELTTLTNQELTASLKTLTGNEREVIVKILFHLIELEKRRSFRELGYSSLYDYCTRALKYSEGSACRRIRASEVLRDNPEVEPLLLSGELNLATISTAAKKIETQEITVADIVCKTKREVELLVARVSPVKDKPKERVKPVFVEAQTKEERYEIKFSVSKETFEKLEAAKKLLSHALGADRSVERIFEALLDKCLKPVEKRQRTNLRTRVVPKSVKQEVFKRDHCQCTYRSPDGRRCEETHYLELDHVIPHSVGGETTVENMRLVCPAHNQLLAEGYFGKSFMEQAIHRPRGR